MLTGCIDEVGRSGLRGWVYDSAYPAASVPLLVMADDRLLERVVANVSRPDVQKAGFGHGRAGFEVVLNPPLNPTRSWLIHVRSEFTGEDMPGSPLRIEASDDFDEAAQRAFAATLVAFDAAEDLDRRIEFLGQQRERLLQMRADRLTPVQPDRSVRRKRALVIDQQMPQPDQDAGSNAILSHMHSLQRLGFDVTFVCSALPGGAAAAALEAGGIACCHLPWYSTVEEVLQRHANAYDVVYLHRVGAAITYLALVRQHMPQARVAFSVADLHHVRLARQAKVEKRPELMAEARRLRSQEIWAAQSADVVITHSSAEAAALHQVMPSQRVHTIPWSVALHPTPVPFAHRSGMAFIGNYRHAPNQDAVRCLRDVVLPRVRRDEPEMTCRVVGSGLPESLRAELPGLVVDGHVPDLHDVFDSVRLTVAPLAYGAGLKGKVLESLAAGVPCVCSPMASEGLDLPASLGQLVVPDEESMARQIIRLHSDEAYNLQMAEHGLAFMAQHCSEARLDRLLRPMVLEGVQ